jgi:hypothetical protein
MTFFHGVLFREVYDSACNQSFVSNEEGGYIGFRLIAILQNKLSKTRFIVL